MISIRDIIRTGSGITDIELAKMISDMMAATPSRERRDWIKQIELSLDGYGGTAQLAAAERVKKVLRDLKSGLVDA